VPTATTIRFTPAAVARSSAWLPASVGVATVDWVTVSSGTPVSVGSVVSLGRVVSVTIVVSGVWSATVTPSSLRMTIQLSRKFRGKGTDPGCRASEAVE
jgi:ABC-type glucose/galactose transport system permease subunit